MNENGSNVTNVANELTNIVALFSHLLKIGKFLGFQRFSSIFIDFHRSHICPSVCPFRSQQIYVFVFLHQVFKVVEI